MKRVTIAVLLVAGIFIALNWQYFKVQLNFYVHPPKGEGQAPDGSQSQEPSQAVEPDRLWIRSLGIEAPLVYVEDETEEDGFQKALQNGVVHYPETAMPGDPGNAYYMGHSSDFPTAPGKYKTVFALLPRIDQGATIEISDSAGKLFKYRVETHKVVNPDDLSVLEQDMSKKQLSIQTSYPVGTALRRYVVIAYLIE